MPSTTPERAARWPGGDSQAIDYLRSNGYALQPGFFWRLPTPTHKPNDKEIDAVLYLVEEWDFDGIHYPPEVANGT